jgi:hypothetical protein
MRHLEKRVYHDYQYTNIGALVPWTILLDIHNAILYGFAQYRWPEPGRSIDIEVAEKHVAKIEQEWRFEAHMQDLDQEWTGAPPLSTMSKEAKLYLHSVLQDAWQDHEIEVARGGF